MILLCAWVYCSNNIDMTRNPSNIRYYTLQSGVVILIHRYMVIGRCELHCSSAVHIYTFTGWQNSMYVPIFDTQLHGIVWCIIQPNRHKILHALHGIWLRRGGHYIIVTKCIVFVTVSPKIFNKPEVTAHLSTSTTK